MSVRKDGIFSTMDYAKVCIAKRGLDTSVPTTSASFGKGDSAPRGDISVQVPKCLITRGGNILKRGRSVFPEIGRSVRGRNS